MNGKQYFDEIAPNWDQVRQGFFSDRVREKAFALAEVHPGALAADIGAGTGFITEGLIQKGVRVVAVDQSEAMLAGLREKFGDAEGLECRVGDVCDIPVADGAVDYVFANMVLHHVESPPVAIREMARILKLDGKLMITDLDEHHFGFLRVEHHDRWMGFKRKDLRRWYVATGLRDVQIECVGEDCCARSSAGGEHASVSIFVASGRK